MDPKAFIQKYDIHGHLHGKDSFVEVSKNLIRYKNDFIDCH